MSYLSKKLSIKDRIYQIRNLPVMLDSELAEIYGVETRSFNQAVKRNIDRFPEQFRFQISTDEYESLRSQIVILKNLSRGQHRKYMPDVFTEQGVAMLSVVLKSKTAVEISIQIMDSFVEMRKFFATHSDLVMRIHHIEQKQVLHEARTQEKFEAIFSAFWWNVIASQNQCKFRIILVSSGAVLAESYRLSYIGSESTFFKDQVYLSAIIAESTVFTGDSIRVEIFYANGTIAQNGSLRAGPQNDLFENGTTNKTRLTKYIKP